MLALKEVDLITQKANTLIEAMPYIRRFNGKTIIVKYGGSAMVDDELKASVIRDVALLKLVGLKPIIVHGGGKEITRWASLSGIESEFYQGLRVTDKETMGIAEMVLNKVNKELVGLMQKMGVNAVGLCGKDGNMIRCSKKTPGGRDIGYVGEVEKVNADLLETLMERDFIPVIAPIGLSRDYEPFNINADDAACAVAKAMNAEKLVFLTDMDGIFMDPEDKKTLISSINIRKARELIADGIVGGGMMPKLQNCIDAIEQGVSRVHILDGRLPHCLLLEFFTQKGIGTVILKDPVL